MTIFFEDIEVGETYEHGSHTVTRDEITAFAERFDPQPFHVDEAAAADSLFGGLIASGWHTASVCMRLLVDGFLRDRASMGALGVDELRWHQPVRPGDTLSIRVDVLDKRPSESNPRIGHVRNELTGVNQHGEAVISWVGLGLFERRDYATR